MKKTKPEFRIRVCDALSCSPELSDEEIISLIHIWNQLISEYKRKVQALEEIHAIQKTLIKLK